MFVIWSFHVAFLRRKSPLNGFSPFLFREAENNLFFFLFFFISLYHATLFWLLLKHKPDNGLGLFQYRNITYLSVAKKRNNILNVEFIMECSKRLPIGYKPQGWLVNFVNFICLQCHYEENLNAALCHYLLHMSHSPSISRLFRIRTCMQSLRCHWWHQ